MQYTQKFSFSLLLSLSLFCYASLFASDSKPEALITIAPYTEIVQKIGGDLISVALVVPQGADSHNFEPSPKEIERESQAKIWFCIGEVFEKRVQEAFKSKNKEMRIVDLRKNLHLATERDCAHAGGLDPHIWMSPKLMIEQAKTIAQGLEEILPEKKNEIEQNLQKVIEELLSLDQEIRKELSEKQGSTIMVTHPSYGYFCHDYGLIQFPIEHEGKDPTAKELTELLQKAKKLKIKKIFAQGYGHKGATLIAKEIGAEVIYLNPYSPHYFQMMREIAKEFREANE